MCFSRNSLNACATISLTSISACTAKTFTHFARSRGMYAVCCIQSGCLDFLPSKFVDICISGLVEVWTFACLLPSVLYYSLIEPIGFFPFVGSSVTIAPPRLSGPQQVFLKSSATLLFASYSKTVCRTDCARGTVASVRTGAVTKSLNVSLSSRKYWRAILYRKSTL